MADSTTASQQSIPGSQLPPPSTQPATQSTEAPTSSAETVTASNNPQADDSNLTAGSADRDIDLGGTDPIDDAIDNDINMNNTEAMPAANGTNDVTAPTNPVAALGTASAPASKKESSLREFLGKMDDYAPIVCFFASLLPHLGNFFASPLYSFISLSRRLADFTLRFPTLLQPTTSQSLVSHPQATAQTKPLHTSPAFWRSQPRNSSLTLQPMHTNIRAFAPPTVQVQIIPWAA